MSIRNLEYLFRPQSVAVIGASNKPQSVGATVMRNLLESSFSGPIMPVNPKHKAIAGILAYPDVAALPETPDLAIIGTPPPTVPRIIAELGARGTKAAVVLTAGLARIKDEQGQILQQKMLEAAQPHLLRILGPNCVGLIIPFLKFNGSFAHTQALPGKIAFVSQSGALTTVVLDWAKSKGIGFSYFISMGDSADTDLGMCLTIWAVSLIHGLFSSILNPLKKRENSFLQPGPRHVISQYWLLKRGVHHRAPKPPPPIPGPSLAQMMFTVPLSAAPACCGLSL